MFDKIKETITSKALRQHVTETVIQATGVIILSWVVVVAANAVKDVVVMGIDKMTSTDQPVE